MFDLAGTLLLVSCIVVWIALIVHVLVRTAPSIRNDPGGLGWGNPAYHASACILAVDEPNDLTCPFLFHRAIAQADFEAGSWLGHCEVPDDPRIHRITVHALEAIALRPDNRSLLV